MTHVAAPVAWRDLVLDKRVDGIGIWHAQKGFGQTHQRHPFIGGKAVFR